MRKSVGAVLEQLLSANGQSLVGEPSRLEALLKDDVELTVRDVNLAMISCRAGVPAKLSNANVSPIPPEIVRQITTSLQDETGLTEAAAVWAVDNWRKALNLDLDREDQLIPNSPKEANSGAHALRQAIVIVGEADFVGRDDLIKAARHIERAAQDSKLEKRKVYELLARLLDLVGVYLVKLENKIQKDLRPSASNTSSHAFSAEIDRWRKRTHWDDGWLESCVARVIVLLQDYRNLRKREL